MTSVSRHDEPPPAAEIAQLRSLAKLLDEAIGIPGTNVRIGLDPILGLIPGAGDVASGALALLVLLRAAKLGVPRTVLTRMASNIAIDALVGTVPVLGDLFDVSFKANTRNLRLIDAHFAAPRDTRRTSRLYVAALAMGVMAAVVGAAVVVVWVIRQLA